MAAIVASSPLTPARKSSIDVLSPRLVRNSKFRQRLREPLLARFELLHGRFTLIRLFAGTLEHFHPAKLGPSECLFALGLRHVEAGVLEEDARPVTVGFEPVDHLRIDDRAGRPRVCESRRAGIRIPAPSQRTTRSVEAGLGVRRHAKRVALGPAKDPVSRLIGAGERNEDTDDLRVIGGTLTAERVGLGR